MESEGDPSIASLPQDDIKHMKRTMIAETVGAVGKKVTVKFVRTGADKVQEYMDYTLENCLVRGYSISADAEGEPIENITLSFTKVMINYNDHDATNKSSSPQRVGYDLETAKPL